jgi:xanthine/CO dehydrogenase XdhC/CoxF family maturation factor
MKELQDIIRHYQDYPGQPLCLATVVNTRGSTYRKAGARMLIANQQQVIGSVSGGCLEADIIAQSAAVWADQQSIVLTYDTTPPEDVLLGTGLGCNGLMEILVEPIAARNPGAHQLELASQIFRRHGTGLIATVSQPNGSAGRKVIHRLMLDAGGTLHGEFPDRAVEQLIVGRMANALKEQRSEAFVQDTGHGAVDVFLEFISAPTPLFVFGAGYDAVPLVRLARDIGMAVTVVDHRAAFATTERFPAADAIIIGRPENVEPIDLPLDQRATAIIMTHNYFLDQQWLKRLLPLELNYLGLMGPRHRAEKMLQELRSEDPDFTAGCDRLFNPAGLDIGAESPEQIALSILGEIQAVLAGTSGGLLREKKGAIHAPQAVPVSTLDPRQKNGIPQCPASVP